MSDSVLGLLFEIAADPSKAILATESFRDEAGNALKEFESIAASTFVNLTNFSKEFFVGLTVGVGAIAAVSAAMFELADKSAEAGTKIYDMSEKTGLSAEKLSGLSAIAKEAGGSFDSLAMGIGRAEVNIQKQIDAGDKATGVLTRLMGGSQAWAEEGLKPVDQRLQDVLGKVFQLNNDGERQAALTALMGRSWQTNEEVLKILTKEGFEPAIEAAKRFGMYFDTPATIKAKEFTVQWEILKGTLEAAAKVAGKELTPALAGVLQVLIGSIRYVEQFGVAFELMAKGQMAGAVLAITAVGAHAKTLVQIMAEVKAEVAELAKVDADTDGKIAAAHSELNKEEKALAKERAAIWKEMEGEHWKNEHEAANEEERLLKETNRAAIKEILDRIKLEKEITKLAGEELGRQDKDIQAEITRNLDVATKERVKTILKGIKDIEKANKEQWATDLKQIEEEERTKKKIHNDEMAMKKAEQELGTSVFEALASGFKKSHDVEVGLIIARAIIKSYMAYAEGTEQAAQGNFAAASLHYIAAAQFAAVGAINAVTSALSGGGGGGGGGRGGGSSASGGSAYGSGGGLPPAMASGGYNTGNLHVIVLGQQDAAQQLATILNNGVRYGGQQVIATQLKGGG